MMPALEDEETVDEEELLLDPQEKDGKLAIADLDISPTLTAPASA